MSSVLFRTNLRDHQQTRRAFWLLFAIVAAIAALVVWAYLGELDEVAVGDSKVTPASRSQMIQSLEGGILAELMVREGDIVETGQKLASLDPALARASVEETIVRIAALQARAARLQAEMDNEEDVQFPEELAKHQEIITRERQLFVANRAAFRETVANLTRQQELADRELKIALPLLKTGATNEVEILRLKQRSAEYASKLDASQSEYYVALKGDFSKTMAELEPLLKIRDGRADQLRRTEITSPTRGIVKDIQISTLGGIVPAGGVLMEVVPLGDQLLIETRISPRDIAFIHPNQPAIVKISAYDSAIYGTLSGVVQRISPDTIEDTVDRRIFYYRIYVLTDNAYLETKDGKRHPILPGMLATTEIRTGRKSVLSYLLKPLNRAGEALRER